MSRSQLTLRVSEIACLAQHTDLSNDQMTMAHHALLDWFGVTLAGFDEPLASILRGAYATGGSSTIVGSSLKTNPRDAALINGATSHALDYDDVNIVGHPTAPILPAALAIGEAMGKHPADILFAYIVGYEAASLVATQAMPSHYTRGFHSTGTLGTIGAAVAVAKLLELDVERMAHAIGLAVTQAAGLKGMFGTMAKPFHAGKAASNGVMAAELAAAGFCARDNGLEMDQGFFSTQSDAEVHAIEHYSFGDHIRQNLFKYHAACYMTHSSMEAARQILTDYQLSQDQIEHVVLTVPEVHLAMCNILEPETGLETKFSLRHCIALTLAGRDTAAISTFSDEAARDPGLVALRDKVTVDGRLPVSTNALVEIATKNGDTYSAAHDVGIPATSMPLQEQRLITKFASLCQARLGGSWRESCDLLLSFNELGSLEEVLSSTRLQG